MARAHPLERFDYQVRIVLRLETRNIEYVAVRLDAPASHRRINFPFDLGAVGNHGRDGSMLREIVILDYFRICNCFGWQNRRQTLSHQVVRAADPIPFFSFVLQAIDVQSDRCSADPKDRSERSVRGIADQRGVVTLWDRMQRRQKSMYDCIEVFVTNRGQDFQPNAMKLEFARTDVMRATIDSDIMSARD